jgi:hypothetical protein
VCGPEDHTKDFELIFFFVGRGAVGIWVRVLSRRITYHSLVLIDTFGSRREAGLKEG